MTMRRILILEGESMLGAGLHRLLSELKDVEVITTEIANLEKLVQIIDVFHPHVLIVDEANLIEISPAFLPLLRKNSILRTILVNLDDNVIQVCDRQGILITKIDDFYELL